MMIFVEIETTFIEIQISMLRSFEGRENDKVVETKVVNDLLSTLLTNSQADTIVNAEASKLLQIGSRSAASLRFAPGHDPAAPEVSIDRCGWR